MNKLTLSSAAANALKDSSLVSKIVPVAQQPQAAAVIRPLSSSSSSSALALPSVKVNLQR